MKKLYYSIGEVSKLTAVEPHVLRYWETVFEELRPRKNKAGNRTYREKDLALIFQLKDLIQEKKYSTSGARKILLRERNGTSTKNRLSPEVKRDLKEIRMFLSRLSENL